MAHILTKGFMMKKIYLIMACLLLSQTVAAKLAIFACEPEWAALSQELGGELINSTSATQAGQDPHHIQARPSLIAKIRQADLLVCSGADLEIGWLPILLRKSANERIQPGQKGYFIATQMVKLLGKPRLIDRSLGDVHAAGNPHIQLDPRRIKIVAKKLSLRLQQLDPTNAALYQQKLSDFSQRWQQASQQWQAKTQALRGKNIIVHHNSWLYLQQWLKLNKVAELEPKPGVAPSSRHLAHLLKQLQKQPADLIIYSTYQNPKAANWLAQKTQIKAIALPATVAEGESLFNWLDRLTDLLMAALQ